MSDQGELYYAEMESARNAVEDAYFSARPSLSKVTASQNELLRAVFRAGFERGFDALWCKQVLAEGKTAAQGETK